MDAPKRTIAFARRLRREMTPPELRLWGEIRRRAMDGVRFRRQHPLGPFILDFYCPAAKLAIEIDGESHGRADQPDHDLRRDGWLAARGIETLRIPAPEVRDNLDGVWWTILHAVKARMPPP